MTVTAVLMLRVAMRDTMVEFARAENSRPPYSLEIISEKKRSLRR
ncbi:Uncharacterised protein [Vibrio cholerae]|nr:Uncharacterised protein [Vibrio cholerae]CSB19461.1 Uncharacterised protein [Vibrio cholerae]CSB20611.1 Uncharacterised protein [Vibrio cholerae]CSB25020.1 Uncharacterised protein [Vibrio cholerae]CSB25294.1 Uncharacterised protein [Vibrio cholerae]